MKVGDIHHSNKTVLFNMQDPIREQLESLTSMVYNTSMQEEENNRPFKPPINQKKRRGQNIQSFCSKLEFSVTEHLVEVVDKLSTTAVVFFRSERILKCKHLYGA